MSSTIFITGATSGIGKALAFEMAKKGYSLALTSRRDGSSETDPRRYPFKTRPAAGCHPAPGCYGL